MGSEAPFDLHLVPIRHGAAGIVLKFSRLFCFVPLNQRAHVDPFSVNNPDRVQQFIREQLGVADCGTEGGERRDQQ